MKIADCVSEIGGSERSVRFVTSSPGQPPNAWQTVYAEASGYVPYEDLDTGFTRFDQVNIPNEFNAQENPNLALHAAVQGQRLVGALGPGAVPSGVPAPTVPGVQLPNIGGQQMNVQASVIESLEDLISRRTASNPFAGTQPAAPAGTPAPSAEAGPSTQPPPMADMNASPASYIGDLIQARAVQLQANPELAGRVVPAAFGDALQRIAGPDGANLTRSNVPEDSNLFGLNTLQRNMALQQLENLIRERATGPDPPAGSGSQSAPR